MRYLILFLAIWCTNIEAENTFPGIIYYPSGFKVNEDLKSFRRNDYCPKNRETLNKNTGHRGLDLAVSFFIKGCTTRDLGNNEYVFSQAKGNINYLILVDDLNGLTKEFLGKLPPHIMATITKKSSSPLKLEDWVIKPNTYHKGNNNFLVVGETSFRQVVDSGMLNWFLHLKAVVDGESNIAENESDPDGGYCRRHKYDILNKLKKQYSKADKKGLADRRDSLEKQFKGLTATCASTISRSIGDGKNNSGDLSKLFYRKLSSDTREKLLNALSRKATGRAVIRGESGEMELKKGPLSEQIAHAANRVKGILGSAKVDTDIERFGVRVLQCIVNRLQISYEPTLSGLRVMKYDDSYYDLAPSKNQLQRSLEGLNPKTCWKYSDGEEYKCRSPGGMLKNCRRSFSENMLSLVNAQQPLDESKVFKGLLTMFYDIHNGLAYVGKVQTYTEFGAGLSGIKAPTNLMFCPNFRSTILPKLKRTFNDDGLYNCYYDSYY